MIYQLIAEMELLEWLQRKSMKDWDVMLLNSMGFLMVYFLIIILILILVVFMIILPSILY